MSLFLSACSTTRFVYRNADWLLARAAEQYVDLDPQQEQLLRGALREQLAWHCQTQLPLYEAWLQRTQQTATHIPVDPVAVKARITELSTFVDAVARQISRPSTLLLRTLNDRQVQDLAHNMAQKQDDLMTDSLGDSAEDQIEARIDRLEDRLEYWLGKLTPEQHERIRQWSVSRTDSTHRWLHNRALWQRAFLAALAHRDQPHFDEDIVALLQHPELFQTPGGLQRRERFLQTSAELATDLLNLTTPDQRKHLLERSESLMKDFHLLTCPA